MQKSLIILSSLIGLILAFIAYREYLISKMTYTEVIQKLRQSRRLYYVLPDTNTPFAKALAKSINFLEKKAKRMEVKNEKV